MGWQSRYKCTYIIKIGRLTCPGFSLCCNDNNNDVAKPIARLRACSLFFVIDLAKRQNNCSLAKLHDSSNLVYDINTEINTKNLNNDNNNKLSYSLSWYRFRPSTIMIKSTSTILKTRHCYVVLVKDVFRDREFHRVLNKKYIDNKVYYLVD